MFSWAWWSSSCCGSTRIASQPNWIKLNELLAIKPSLAPMSTIKRLYLLKKLSPLYWICRKRYAASPALETSNAKKLICRPLNSAKNKNIKKKVDKSMAKYAGYHNLFMSHSGWGWSSGLGLGPGGLPDDCRIPNKDGAPSVKQQRGEEEEDA